MPNEVKLLPCPFCECGDREMPPVLTVTKEGPVVICTACSAMGPTRRTKAEAIAAWNHRPTTVVTDEVVGLREALKQAVLDLDEAAGRFAIHTELDLLACSQLTREAARRIEARAAIASMPTVVTGEQPQSVGVPASPSGHSAEPEPSSTVSAVPVSVPNAAVWSQFYSDGSEGLTVSYDTESQYFPNAVEVSPYGRITDSAIYIEVENVRWLAARLLDAASAIEARRAETQGVSVADESAVAESETPTPSPAQPGDA